MHKVRNLGILYLAIVMVLLLGACGPTPTAEPTEPPATEEPEKVKIVWWAEAYAEPAREVIVQGFVDTFNAAHDDIELEIIFQEDRGRVTQTAVQAGAGPDIVTTFGPAAAGEYVAAGHLLALDEYAEEFGWQEELLPWAYDVGTVSGRLYSLPLNYETLLLWVNKTVLKDQLGLEPPTNLAELENVCNKAEEADVWCFAGHSNFGDNFQTSLIWEQYAGADNFYKALVQEKAWDDPVFVEALALQKDMIDRGWFSGDLETFSSLEYGDSASAFCGGQAALKMNGTWAFGAVAKACAEADQEWDWVMFPSLNEGVEPVFDLAIGETVSINASTEHPREAALVLDWLFNDKERAAGLIEEMSFSQWLVPLKFTSDDFSPAVDDRIIRFIEEFATVTGEERIGYTIWTFFAPDGFTMLEEDIEEVWAGTVSPEEFLANLQSVHAKDYADGTVPPAPPTGVTSPE